MLDDPESFKTKEESKKSVLDYILQPNLYPELYKDLCHVVRINYYPPRGDNKEGWDNIDIFGWLNYKMQLKVNFLCRDSILAAPIVLDVALFLDLAKRAGMEGIQEWLSFYFKSPMHAAGLYPEHDLFIQMMKLKNTLRFLRGEDLITHLGPGVLRLMDSGRLQPALYGGLVIGVLSALPIVNAGNCCCCLWVVAGRHAGRLSPPAELAVFGHVGRGRARRAARRPDRRRGLRAAVDSAAGVDSRVPAADARAAVASNPDLPPEVRQGMERWATGAALQTVGALVNVVVFTVFGMLGGLLGAAVFKRNAPPPPQGTIEVLPPE